MLLEVVNQTSDFLNTGYGQLGAVGLLIGGLVYLVRYLVNQYQRQIDLHLSRLTAIEEENKKLNQEFISHLLTTEGNLLSLVEQSNTVIGKNTHIFESILTFLSDWQKERRDIEKKN